MPGYVDSMRDQIILITGGAGFVGANLAILLKKAYPSWHLLCLDNLKRRGSNLNLKRLMDNGITFIHGDVRAKEDLEIESPLDVIIECSAEPSVLAGYNSSPYYVINTNLMGTINCLELARKKKGALIYLSTSRVYPINKLNSLNFEESETRYILSKDQPFQGASEDGIATNFPISGYRSLYGASKLSSELIINEYIYMYDLKAIINRCSVITGPWQMGKVDQGVFAYWMLAHYFKKELCYFGFGGHGKQVRDLLHINDLFELVKIEIEQLSKLSGKTYNVGGGRKISLSLREATEICREITGNRIPVMRRIEDREADIRIYISDNKDITKDTGWQPNIEPKVIISDIYYWIKQNEKDLENIFLLNW